MWLRIHTVCAVYTIMNMESTGIMFTGNTDYSLTNNYTQWLQQWQKPFPLSIHVPPEACKIVIPLQPIAWRENLAMHPDHNLTTFFISSITQGFRIGFDHTLVSQIIQEKFGKCTIAYCSC